MRKLRPVVALLAAVTVATAPAAALGGTAAIHRSATGHATIIRLTAVANGLRYDKATLRAKAGKVTVVLTNRSPLQHDVRIELGKRQLGGTKRVAQGKSASVTLTLKKGTYTFFCSVPGHEAAGMKGVLRVS